MIEDVAQLHISEAELARDLHAVLEKVRQGTEVVVEDDDRPVAILRPADPPRRTISECIAVAEQREKERGYPVTLDPDFAADVEEIVQPEALEPTIVGLILDTGTIVKAERRGHSVPQMLSNVREACGETEIGLSVVTIAELTHGVYRAKLETHRQMPPSLHRGTGKQP
jgi:antitoxin (DNA-binding transcriptional repressor) of toxin-antitoxin stability system